MDVSPGWCLARKMMTRDGVDVLLMKIECESSARGATIGMEEEQAPPACEIGGCRGGDCRETVADGVPAGARRCCLIRPRP